MSAITVESIPPEEWLHNPTPGDILLEEFLKPIGMSQTALAKALGLQIDHDLMEQRREMGALHSLSMLRRYRA